MSIFGKKEKQEISINDEIQNPLNNIIGNDDFSGQTFVNKQSNNQNNNMSIIAANSIFEGVFKSEGDITVNGKVKGTITTKGKILIGSTGSIEGDLLSQNAEISGTVTGKVEIADLLFLKGTAQINGDIYTDKIIIEKEARFNGKCVMNHKGAAQSKPNTLKPE